MYFFLKFLQATNYLVKIRIVTINHVLHCLHISLIVLSAFALVIADIDFL